jgi:1,4-alpha-glucan branching enzyme
MMPVVHPRRGTAERMGNEKDTSVVRAERVAPPLISPHELDGFGEGTHARLYDVLGAHPRTVDGVDGVRFAVWAPAAKRVAVVGDFNGWDPTRHALQPLGRSGVWCGHVPGIGGGALYKYRVESRLRGYVVNKADPFGFRCQTPPETASVVWPLDYEWRDARWLARRERRQAADAPLSIYELHLGSWKRPHGGLPDYRSLAAELVPYLKRMQFTHVEFLPPKEHPFYGSWGYQTTGFFAATNRYGSPQDLMHLVDELHRHGFGVIFDWVAAHFPRDEHGLIYFDGTHLYEHADPRLGHHPDWQSAIFNYGRGCVRSFLLSSAMFWLDRYHADGLRVDAVASMLYLDYSRKEGEWLPNKFGGRENLDAISLLRLLNDTVHRHHRGVLTIAEESTTWPMVSRPTHLGGLGFDMKWDMGWMHDTLDYLRLDPILRKYNHQKLTFRGLYAFSENFVLPMSHDEVVHGKGSLLAKMPGDDWQKFATLRLLYGYMFALPGKKLLFMGSELGQWREWSHERELDWHLLQYPLHDGLRRWVADLNGAYRRRAALHQLDFSSEGFRWIDCGDADQSVVAFLRRGQRAEDLLLAVSNFTPVPRHNSRVGVPLLGTWRERLNSDAVDYGGSGQGNLGAVASAAVRYHGCDHSLLLTLPPLSAIWLEPATPSPPLQVGV